MINPLSIPAVSVTYAQDGTSTQPNALGMRPMQERAYQKRGEQYLLIKSPPASGKSRARFTNLIAEPDTSEAAVTEAVNIALKAIMRDGHGPVGDHRRLV